MGSFQHYPADIGDPDNRIRNVEEHCSKWNDPPPAAQLEGYDEAAVGHRSDEQGIDQGAAIQGRYFIGIADKSYPTGYCNQPDYGRANPVPG